MLTSLHIRDFAIIDALDIELSSGMTTLTGETGAGKSILLDALALLLGDRADTDVVRHGAERAEISASFDLRDLPSARDWLSAQSIEGDDECQLRRVLAGGGRSRAFINASPVPLQSLRELGALLVDIHGQHEHQSLMQRAAQRELLDRHGECGERLAGVAGLHAQWQDTLARMEALLGKDQDRASKLEFLRFQVTELDQLAVAEGEVEGLHDELRRLSNAGQLIDTTQRCLAALYDAEDVNAQHLVGRARQDIATLARLDTALAPVGDALDNALIQIEDAVGQLRDYQARLEQDPQRLHQVEERLDRLHDVARKHRIESDALPALTARLRRALEELEQADTLLAGLEAARDRLANSYRVQARQLGKERASAAARLSAAVTEAMQALGMQGGRFAVEVEHQPDAPPSPNGTDRIEFLVAANPGQPLKPLTRVASGGELSRISLAIQVIAARAVSIPTLIFDEVDSGVGGAVAETVGRQLHRLACERQVLCVTHLPQVAAQADHHLQVTKLTGEETARTRVRELSATERVEEIARMLGGSRITEPTRAHAREMLGSGDKPKGRKRPSG